MDTLELPQDFKEFLKLLNAHGVKYLVVGGYAVNFHGYARGTNDLDIWVAIDPSNAQKLVETLQEFGFGTDKLSVELFLKPDQIVRMGVQPVMIEVSTTIDGVDFDECYASREAKVIDDIEINFIDREHLKRNKRAAGRFKDLDDLQNL